MRRIREKPIPQEDGLEKIYIYISYLHKVPSFPLDNRGT
jgi:hypothetical protein